MSTMRGPLTRAAQHAAKAPRRSLNIIAADEGAMSTKVYHTVNLAILGLTPVAFLLSPSKMNFPVDLALGVMLPLHGHIGMNYVITDYAAKLLGSGARGPARIGMLAFTGISVAGLTKLNLTGPGITETVKAMWRKQPKE